MNHNQLNRQLAMNYAILRKLIQDDAALNRVITRDNLMTLLDIPTFYNAHFGSVNLVEFFPQIHALLHREVESAFGKLKPRVKIYNRYDEAYPKSIVRDLGLEAPLFIYVCGDVELFDRKIQKLSLIANTTHSDSLFRQSLDLIQQFDGSQEALVLSQLCPLNSLVYRRIHELQISSIVVVNHALDKTIFKSTFFPCNQTKVKHMLVSAIGPEETNLSRFQGLTDAMGAALSKAGILLSHQTSDLRLEGCARLMAAHKPVFVPLMSVPKHELLIPVAAEHVRSTIEHMLNS
jgi:hypothetical protein